MIELPIQQLIFLFLAAVAVFAAFNVIMQRNPLYSALGLIVTMCALSGTYLLLEAQFLAVMQVIVYAGAVMILFMFVIMLLNVRTEEARKDKLRYLQVVAPLLFIALLAEVFFVARTVKTMPTPSTVDASGYAFGTVESVGEALFSTYLFPFEATSVLILMAMVGALALARKRTQQEAETLGRLIDETNQPSLTPAQPAGELEAKEEKEELAA